MAVSQGSDANLQDWIQRVHAHVLFLDLKKGFGSILMYLEDPGEAYFWDSFGILLGYFWDYFGTCGILLEYFLII